MIEADAAVNEWTAPSTFGVKPVQRDVSKPGESKPFCRIPRWFMDTGIWAKLSRAEVRLIGAIAYHANWKRGSRAWPRAATLIKMSGLHPETLRIAKRRLRKLGLIEYGFALDMGRHCIWLAIAQPFDFSDDCKKHREVCTDE